MEWQEPWCIVPDASPLSPLLLFPRPSPHHHHPPHPHPLPPWRTELVLKMTNHSSSLCPYPRHICPDFQSKRQKAYLRSPLLSREESTTPAAPALPCLCPTEHPQLTGLTEQTQIKEPSGQPQHLLAQYDFRRVQGAFQQVPARAKWAQPRHAWARWARLSRLCGLGGCTKEGAANTWTISTQRCPLAAICAPFQATRNQGTIVICSTLCRSVNLGQNQATMSTSTPHSAIGYWREHVWSLAQIAERAFLTNYLGMLRR